MKYSIKKIGALAMAIVMICALFVGCAGSGYDTSTPDGALMTRLSAVKTGNLSQIEGYNKAIMEQIGISEVQLKDTAKSLYGQNKYTVENVEMINDTEAKVTVSGQAIDMEKFLPVFVTGILDKAMEFTVKNSTSNMTQQETVKQAVTIVVNVIKAKKSFIELKDVTVTVTMQKRNHQWDIALDKENMERLIELALGSTPEKLVESIEEFFAGGQEFFSGGQAFFSQVQEYLS